MYQLHRDGSSYAVLKSFTGANGDGASPYAGLIQASNGTLFGTTANGGDNNQGTVFKLESDGSGFAVVKSFTGTSGDGAQPHGSVAEANDGRLYGTTALGGDSNQGTVFRLDIDGGGYSVLKSFMGTSGDAAQPYSALVQATNGALFGTTYRGGIANQGTVFTLNPDGTGYQVLKGFNSSSGLNPASELIFGTNGMLYGTTSSPTDSSLYRLNSDGSAFQVLTNFLTAFANAVVPSGALLQGSDGSLYGMTRFGGVWGNGTVFRLNLDGSGFAWIRHFIPTGGDGVNPEAALTQGTNGALYGTTLHGASNGQGAVFTMNDDGTGYAVLRSFTGTNGDGADPYGGLIQTTDGVLYGITSYDRESGGVLYGNGTLFKLNPDGSGYVVLRRFNGGNDGANPFASLLQANDQLLYGTTFHGGSNNSGTVFRLNMDGSGYTVLRRFSGSAGGDGASPQAAMIQCTDGALYGTTQSGGSGSGGTAFKLNMDGSGYQVLRRFGGADGTSPQAGLLQGQDGALYGTTLSGGPNNGGTVFRLNPGGTGFVVLRSFTGVGGDGKWPRSTMVQSRSGVLYGTTSSGGASGCGTIFQINPDGSGYTVLKSFLQNSYDGNSPHAGLLLVNDGTLYGTTSAGGRDQNGTIFLVVPPAIMLPPVPGAGGCLITFFGLPSRTYTIERSVSPSGPWVSLGPTTVGGAGVGQVIDPTPPAVSGFYRTSVP